MHAVPCACHAWRHAAMMRWLACLAHGCCYANADTRQALLAKRAPSVRQLQPLTFSAASKACTKSAPAPACSARQPRSVPNANLAKVSMVNLQCTRPPHQTPAAAGQAAASCMPIRSCGCDKVDRCEAHVSMPINHAHQSMPCEAGSTNDVQRSQVQKLLHLQHAAAFGSFIQQPRQQRQLVRHGGGQVPPQAARAVHQDRRGGHNQARSTTCGSHKSSGSSPLRNNSWQHLGG